MSHSRNCDRVIYRRGYLWNEDGYSQYDCVKPSFSESTSLPHLPKTSEIDVHHTVWSSILKMLAGQILWGSGACLCILKTLRSMNRPLLSQWICGDFHVHCQWGTFLSFSVWNPYPPKTFVENLTERLLRVKLLLCLWHCGTSPCPFEVKFVIWWHKNTACKCPKHDCKSKDKINLWRCYKVTSKTKRKIILLHC